MWSCDLGGKVFNGSDYDLGAGLSWFAGSVNISDYAFNSFDGSMSEGQLVSFSPAC